MFSIFLISINTIAIVILAVNQHNLTNEIYDLRARILDLEIKNLNKKDAVLRRIK
jgi:hypothetical protein